jgi:hypothetical protein
MAGNPLENLDTEKKRKRNDTFWSFSDEDNGKLFDDILKGKNQSYQLQTNVLPKLDHEETQKPCWQLFSYKTGQPATTIRSTKPYRLAMLWSVTVADNFWGSPEMTEQVRSQLPNIIGKTGEHSRHRCGRDWCCNPSHITIGSRASNEVDKHFHYFLNHLNPDVSKRFRETFSDLMKEQGVW